MQKVRDEPSFKQLAKLSEREGVGGFVVKIRQQASTFLFIRNLYKELRDGDRQFYPISENRNIFITLSGN